jgi:hypothetical protein
MPTSSTPPAFNRLGDSEDGMKHDHHFAKMARFFAALAWLIGVVACPAFGQNIIDQTPSRCAQQPGDRAATP